MVPFLQHFLNKNNCLLILNNRLKRLILSCLNVYLVCTVGNAFANDALVIQHLYDFESRTTDSEFVQASTEIEAIQSAINHYHDQSTAVIAPQTENTMQTVETASSDTNNDSATFATEDGTSQLSALNNEKQSDNQATEVIVGDLWDRIRIGFAMPNIQHPLVKKYEKLYCKNPALLSDMIHRAEKYLYHVTTAVEQQQLPSETALLPIIESRYNPVALSRTRAAGLWQIMPATGKYLGLRQNWWTDDRRNVLASTDAALTYLTQLHQRFGQWDLAFAAYNAGGGTISRAVKRNAAAKKSTGYLNLKLPKETREYLPKLQAIKNIVSSPEKYGVKIKTIKDQPYFSPVTVPKQIDKALLAQLAEISTEELNALNPDFKRPLIAQNKTQQVLLPVQAAQRFEYNLSVYDKPLVSWQAYTMQKGERLSQVAKLFGMHVKQLGTINQLSTQFVARRTHHILVPNPKVLQVRNAQQENKLIATDEILVAKRQVSNLPASIISDLSKNSKPIKKYPRKRNKTYLVKRGDTLSEIAKRFKVSMRKLQRLNHLKRRLIKTGQRIKLY